MMQDIRDAERAGAVVYNVELSKIWMELLKHRPGISCGDRWGSELVKMWGDFVNIFLNSKMHCLALGRVGDITEDVYNDRNEIKRVKIAEGMKAGGQRTTSAMSPTWCCAWCSKRSRAARAGEGSSKAKAAWCTAPT
jgi:hypothetical protein